MKGEPLSNQPGAWMPVDPDDPVTVSSRIRLARNVKDTLFPGWAGEEECQRIWTLLRTVLLEAPTMDPGRAWGMDELSGLDRLMLFERHLISREQMERGAGSGVVIREDERLAVMVNEEDHLRLQALQPGLDLRTAWAEINQMDSEIEAQIDYAFSPRIGYLTACPSNVGTGMRASVMLHVPGLVAINEMQAVVKGVAKIGLAVRGLWGEGSEAAGNMYQISNQMTLGEKEIDIISHLEQIVQEIVQHERNARLRLFEQREELVRDQAGRALGVLSQAYVLTSKEALDLLSDLRLGVDMGIIILGRPELLNDLLIMIQPGHLQHAEARKLKAAERDVARATLVRAWIKKAQTKPRKKKHNE
jgi:protein arginine kinase